MQPPPNSVSNEKDGSDQREVAEEPPGEETQRGADEPEPVGEESSVEHQNEARPRGDFAIQDEQDEGPAAPPAYGASHFHNPARLFSSLTSLARDYTVQSRFLKTPCPCLLVQLPPR